MSYLFTAQFAFSEDNGETMTASLADSQFEASRYITFQRAYNPTKQDKLLGMEGVYIEVDDQIHSSYGGIEDVQLFAERLEVRLDEKAAKAMKLPPYFSIGLAHNLDGLSAFSEMLLRIMGGSIKVL
jgi:hypothetical protein